MFNCVTEVVTVNLRLVPESVSRFQNEANNGAASCVSAVYQSYLSPHHPVIRTAVFV